LPGRGGKWGRTPQANSLPLWERVAAAGGRLRGVSLTEAALRHPPSLGYRLREGTLSHKG